MAFFRFFSQASNHRFKIILRVILLGLVLFMFFFAIMQKEWYVTSYFLIAVFILQIIELICFLERWNREFNQFLVSVKQQDFTNVYPALSDTSPEFRLAFKDLMQVYQQIKIEKELHYQYLKTLLENIRVAVICFTETGTIVSINPTAKKLLNIPSIHQIQSISRISPAIYETIVNIQSSSRELIHVKTGKELLQLAVYGTRFKLQESNYVLVSLQDIRYELEQQEVDSWKKLIRVLTHEIMNSVTPISSLSSALNALLKDEHGVRKELSSITKDDLVDIQDGLNTIENRSKGLIKFVTTYKSLTKLPVPVFTEVSVTSLFSQVHQLIDQDLIAKKIMLTEAFKKPLGKIRADQGLIEQVLINLLNNATEALTGTINPQITCKAFSNSNFIMVEICDNGKGISPEVIQDIFIPFFTTKANGSGIGLSLSRQIMQLHGGTITVHSIPGKETVFTLKFPIT